MGFQLDTSGFVQGWVPPHGERRGYVGPNRIAWSGLDPFMQGYVEALIEALGLQYFGDGESDDTPQHAAFSDLAPETLARIVEDCAACVSAQGNRAYDFRAYQHMGRLFWQIRQGGPWANFPPLTPYLGDDGKVYLREAIEP